MKRLAYSAQVRELILEGTLSYGQIAALTGCTRAYCANTRRLLKLERRKPGRRKGFTATPTQKAVLDRGRILGAKAQQDSAWNRAQQIQGSAA